MKIQFRFHSELYAANPQSERSRQRQSKRLSEFLSRRLVEEGVAVTFVDPGEYGTLTITVKAPFSLCMDCQHADETRGDWICTIDGSNDFFQNLFKPVDPTTDVCYLQSVFQRILSEAPDVEGIEWSLDIDRCDLPD